MKSRREEGRVKERTKRTTMPWRGTMEMVDMVLTITMMSREMGTGTWIERELRVLAGTPGRRILGVPALENGILDVSYRTYLISAG